MHVCIWVYKEVQENNGHARGSVDVKLCLSCSLFFFIFGGGWGGGGGRGMGSMEGENNRETLGLEILIHTV